LFSINIYIHNLKCKINLVLDNAIDNYANTHLKINESFKALLTIPNIDF